VRLMITVHASGCLTIQEQASTISSSEQAWSQLGGLAPRLSGTTIVTEPLYGSVVVTVATVVVL
jgi:hypothetical protein